MDRRGKEEYLHRVRSHRRSIEVAAGGVSAVSLMRAAGMEPDPKQKALLESTSSRILLLCTRQWGKSTTTAAIALSDALREEGSLILLLAPSQRQAGELLRKVLDCYNGADRPVAAEREGALQLELANGSRIIALPGKEGTVRGFSGVRRLIIDEASQVPDALYFSVRPMLAVSGGSLIALSSPRGKRGWFYEAYEKGGPVWERHRVSAPECPRISAEFLAEEREALGDWWYSQEYLCAWLDTTDQYFSGDAIERALTDEFVPLFGAAEGALLNGAAEFAFADGLLLL